MTVAECPFLPLCERDFRGPALEDGELEQLQAHLAAGCPACEERIEEHLTGSGAYALTNREVDAVDARHARRSRRKLTAVRLAAVNLEDDTPLLEIVRARCPPGRLTRPRQRWQQQGRQNRDNRNHYKEFD